MRLSPSTGFHARVLFLHNAKEKCDGGGVAIIHTNTIGVAETKAASECRRFSSFEFVGSLLFVNSICIDLLVIYYPPLNGISLFLEDFNSLLQRVASSTTKTIITHAGPSNLSRG